MDKIFLPKKQTKKKTKVSILLQVDPIVFTSLHCACRASESTVADSEFLQILQVEIPISEFKYKDLTIGFRQKSSSPFAKKIAVESRDKVNRFLLI